MTKDGVKVYFAIAQIATIFVGIVCCITIIGLILGIPLLIASGRFGDAKNMNDAELINNRVSLKSWGIVVAILLSATIVGLIVMLVLVFAADNYIRNLDNNKENDHTSFKEGVSTLYANTKEDLYAAKIKGELDALQKLLDNGIITKKEYDAKRKQILDIK